MEHITFIDLNSATCRMGIGKNTVRVRIENKDKRIVFNKSVTKELAKLRPTHCNVGVGDDSKSHHPHLHCNGIWHHCSYGKPDIHSGVSS